MAKGEPMSNLQRLQDAFPSLVWTPSGRAAYQGRALMWCVLVECDLSYAFLEGPAPPVTKLGTDPIADLRAALAAEGARLAKQADAYADAARMLGGAPQADWRAAIAKAHAIALDPPPDRPPAEAFGAIVDLLEPVMM